MPSGTGKTVSLLSLVVAYMLRFPDHLDKLVYCSRTIPEIEKCVEELRNLFKYYEQCDGVSIFFVHPKKKHMEGGTWFLLEDLAISLSNYQISLFHQRTKINKKFVWKLFPVLC